MKAISFFYGTLLGVLLGQSSLVYQSGNFMDVSKSDITEGVIEYEYAINIKARLSKMGLEKLPDNVPEYQKMGMKVYFAGTKHITEVLKNNPKVLGEFKNYYLDDSGVEKYSFYTFRANQVGDKIATSVELWNYEGIATGETKRILGYEVREIQVSTEKGLAVIWVTEELPSYVSPSFISSEKGTILEVTTPNGDILKAIRIDHQEVPPSIFESFNQYEKKTPEQLNQLLGNAKKEYQNAWIGKSVSYSFRDLKGTNSSFEELRGKIVVINFWFAGCKPCLKEMPELNRLVLEHNNKEVVFLAFTFDSEHVLNRFLAKREFSYKIIPSSEPFISEMNVEFYPTHMILDKNGTIRFVMTGAAENIYEILNAEINKYKN